MSSFIPESILQLAGLRLDTNEGKFVFNSEIKDEINKAVVTEEPYSVESTDNSNKDISNGKVDVKKKKNKRRKRANSTNVIKKNVNFGYCEEILFDRDIGSHCVPTKGSFPLALGKELRREVKTFRQDSVENKDNNILHRQLRSSTAESKSHNIKSDDGDGFVESKLIQPKTEKERQSLIEADVSEESRKELTFLDRELKSIRENRTFNGCSCKPIKADKLSIVRMKQELLSNSHISGFTEQSEVDVLSKTQLLAKVKDMLKSCHLCVSNQCECVVNGIPCSMEACGCIRRISHVGDKTALAQTCANNNGQIIFDFERVRNYRQRVLLSINPDTLTSSLQVS